MKSTLTYAAAIKAAATVNEAWCAHYAATNQDVRDGFTTKQISDAWRKAKVTGPTSVAMVASMADAMALAGLQGGEAYPAAVEKVYGEGTLLPAHVLLERVRKAHGVAHYRAILKALMGALGAAGDDQEEKEKAIVKAIRELKAGSKAVKQQQQQEDADGEESGEEENGEETAATPATATPADKAASIAAVAHSLRKDLEGGAVLSDEMTAALMSELSLLAAAVKKAGKAAA